MGPALLPLLKPMSGLEPNAIRHMVQAIVFMHALNRTVVATIGTVGHILGMQTE